MYTLEHLKPGAKSTKIFILVAAAFIMAAVFALITTSPTSAAACQAPTTDYGTATLGVTIPQTTTYRIWSRIMVPSTTANTYLLEVDGQHCFTVGGGTIAPNTWVWVAHQNSNIGSKIDLSLSQGNHTLKLIGRQPGVKVNSFVFTSDLNCTPTGNGSNCDQPADTIPPSVSLTAPEDLSTVKGTIDITASANDNNGVAKVEFYVNSALLGTDTSAPYAFKWNTTTAPNGSQQLLTAKAYDAAGNVISDSVRVTVQNADTQPPSAPANVKATATSYNLVTLTWGASADGSGIKGYSIMRNGVFLAEVGAVTSYDDKTVLANTEYKYQITAIDTAGNKSVPSAEAVTKTPNVADTQAPSVPGSVTATAASATQINLNWKASTDNIAVAGYDVYRGNQKIATVKTTSFGDAELRPGTQYTYTVRAKDAAGNTSAPSAQASATTKPATQRLIVRGKVTDRSNNRPLRYALIEVKVANKRHFSFTNRQGEFTFRGLEPGRYTVVYRAFGYEPRSVRVTINEGQSQVLQTISLQKRSRR